MSRANLVVHVPLPVPEPEPDPVPNPVPLPVPDPPSFARKKGWPVRPPLFSSRTSFTKTPLLLRGRRFFALLLLRHENLRGHKPPGCALVLFARRALLQDRTLVTDTISMRLGSLEPAGEFVYIEPVVVLPPL